MDRHFDEELKELKAKILSMGSMVESQIQRALRPLTERDSALARRVIENDHGVNALDVDAAENCLRLLALHHPSAGQLHLITTPMQIHSNLEPPSHLAALLPDTALQ